MSENNIPENNISGARLSSTSKENIVEKIYEDTNRHILRELIEKMQVGVDDAQLNSFLSTAVNEVISEWDKNALSVGAPILSEDDRNEIRDRFFQTLGYGKLEVWLKIPNAENVHIFGADKVLVSYDDGTREVLSSTVGNEEELIELVRFLATTKSRTTRRFDIASPILDLRLPSGHRLFAIMSVSNEPYVVVRYHHHNEIDIQKLYEYGTVSEPMIELIRHAILPPHPANILIGGGTSAGKTTTLRALLNEIPKNEVLVTIEDTLELQLREKGQHELCFELETRQANVEGIGEINMYQLTRAALRMAPDRVIVGEVRGPEIMQLLNAMGQGNDGSIGTIHADSSLAVISRILTYSQRSLDAATPDFVLRQIGQTLDLVFFVSLLPNRQRAVTSVREILGYHDGEVFTSEIFALNPKNEVEYMRAPHPSGKLISKVLASGFDPATLGTPKQKRHIEIPDSVTLAKAAS